MRFADFVEINPPVTLERDSEYPFVGMEAIVPGRRYVHAQRMRVANGGGARFQVGDTLFARITPCLENGKIAQFAGCEGESGFGSTEFYVFRAKQGVSDPGYVFYLASADAIRKPAEKSMRGASGRQRADLQSIEDSEVPAPKLPIQQKIAGILSAYDGLIENNARRMEILEQMAQALYREWFVRPCQSGKLPKGWRMKKVTETVYVNPRTLVPKETEKPYVPMNSLSTASMLIGDFEIRTGNSGSKYRNGDTLFARITPCLENGKTAFVQFLPSDNDVAIGSTEFIVLRSRTLCPEYVYLMARSDAFRDHAIKSMSGASGRQRVQEKCFEKFTIAQPDAGTLEKFMDCIGPMFRLVHSLAQKNANLRRTRDLLLPKLISGEVDVSGLAIDITGRAE